MPLSRGGTHGAFGLVSVLLTIKVVVLKGLFLIDDIVTHQLVHLPLEIVLVELPISVFGTVGRLVIGVTGVTLPAEGVGLIVVYPLFAVATASVLEEPTPRIVAAYWTSTTIVTVLAVGASVGLVPDPAGAGSGLAYHLQHHTLAHVTRDVLLSLGTAMANVIAARTGLEVEEAIGLVALSGVSFVFGALWEVTIGHD